MNKGKIAIMGADNMHSTWRYNLDTTPKDGYKIVSADKEEDVFSPTKFFMALPNVEPICLEPCFDNRLSFNYKHCRDEAHFSKSIARRRKRNKNKKTHR